MEAINKTKKKDLILVDPRQLKIEDWNPRFDLGDIEELKNSIIENGVLTPFVGYKEGDFFIVVAGHRRYTATMLAIEEGHDIKYVSFQSIRKPSMDEKLILTVLSNDSKNMTPLELGETYKRLVQYGWTITEIAKRVGKTYKHVSDLTNVASDTSKELKNMITDGVVSTTLVAELNAVTKDSEKTEEIIKNSVNPNTKKITKKSIQTNLLQKNNFSYNDVIDLLQKQRQACAERLTDEIDLNLVLNTPLVIMPKKEKKEKLVLA